MEIKDEAIKQLREWHAHSKDLEPGELVEEICGLCGCGTAGKHSVGALLYEVLKWCASGDARYVDGDKGCYRSQAWELAAKVLDKEDLIEHGTGIGWPWVTIRGEQLLALIDEVVPEKES